MGNHKWQVIEVNLYFKFNVERFGADYEKEKIDSESFFALFWIGNEKASKWFADWSDSDKTVWTGAGEAFAAARCTETI